MGMTMLRSPRFDAFFAQSKVFAELRALVRRELARQRSRATRDADMGIQLVAETVIKHNLSRAQIGSIDFLSFIDRDNSPEVRSHYKPVARELRRGSDAGVRMSFDVRRYAIMCGLIMARQADDAQRDLCRELKAEFLTRAAG